MRCLFAQEELARAGRANMAGNTVNRRQRQAGKLGASRFSADTLNGEKLPAAKNRYAARA
jgi:hypothetical protein